jgi:AcrR family transcriptional regulator
MRPLGFLKCLGKAALKQAANLAGFGLADVVEEVWSDWNKDKDAAQRQAELQAVVQMAADQFRQQVEAVVRDVAAGQPEAVRRHVSDCLQQVPDQLRRSFRRPDDPHGASVPPGFGAKQMVSEILSHLPVPRAERAQAAAARPQVTLEFTHDQLQGQTRSFSELTTLVLGRHKDCEPRFAREGHQRISRHRALVEINPPDVCLRDLGNTVKHAAVQGRRATAGEGLRLGSHFQGSSGGCPWGSETNRPKQVSALYLWGDIRFRLFSRGHSGRPAGPGKGIRRA